MAAMLPAVTPIIVPPGVFKGRELTRKDRRLGATLEPINVLLEGGIPRGRISEIVGRGSCGKTSLAAAFIGSATCRGEVAAIIDLANSFDPATMAEGGVDLSRVLWVHPCGEKIKEILEINGILEVYQDPLPRPLPGQGEGIKEEFLKMQGEQTANRRGLNQPAKNFLRAAELVLEAGGFGLMVMDFGEGAFTLTSSSALRLARMAERSGTAVLMLVTRPVCGTFAAISMELAFTRAIFSQGYSEQSNLRQARFRVAGIRGQAPSPVNITGEGVRALLRQPTFFHRALFEGIEIKAHIRRNKVGRSGLSAQWRSMVNPADLPSHSSAPLSIRSA